MKKICFTFLLVLLHLSAQSQPDRHTNMNTKQLLRETKVDFNGVDELSALDIEILCLMPTLKDYDFLESKLKTLSVQKIKLIDSIDFSTVNKSNYTVKIYLQSYAYKSSNSYKLVVDKKSKKQELILTNMNYNMKMKDIIEDYEVLRDKKISYSIQRKTLDDGFNTQRIIITKKDV